MSASARSWVLGGVTLLGCLVGLALAHSAWAWAPPNRNYPRAQAARQQPQQMPRQQPSQQATGPEVAPPKEAVLGDDHQQNIKALQQEKLDLIHQRVALLNRAFSAGQLDQRQLDQALVEQLNMELDALDRPHLRVLALEQLITILKRFEEEARDNISTGKRANDVSAAASAHGRYVHARMRRLDAQIRLEKEKLAQQQEAQKGADPAPASAPAPK